MVCFVRVCVCVTKTLFYLYGIFLKNIQHLYNHEENIKQISVEEHPII